MNHPNANRILRFSLFLVTGLLAVSTCEARTKLVDSWKNKEVSLNKPEKIAVIAVLPDGLIRESVETDVAAKLQRKGRTVIAGSSVPGMWGGMRGEIDTETASAALRKASVDGVIVMFYRGGVTDSYKRTSYSATYEGSAVGYSWGHPYFVEVYSIERGEGYSDTARSALVESSYYDLETRQPLWRIVTQTKDIENSDAAIEIAKKIASQMKSAGL